MQVFVRGRGVSCGCVCVRINRVSSKLQRGHVRRAGVIRIIIRMMIMQIKLVGPAGQAKICLIVAFAKAKK